MEKRSFAISDLTVTGERILAIADPTVIGKKIFAIGDLTVTGEKQRVEWVGADAGSHTVTSQQE